MACDLRERLRSPIRYPGIEDEAADAIDRFEAQLIRAMTALDASLGYLKNADIDLATGAKKRTARNTIQGGIKMVESALIAIGEAAALTLSSAYRKDE